MTKFVVGSCTAGQPGAFVLEPEKNMITGIRSFRNFYGEPTSLEMDCLRLAAAIFSADLAQRRGEREAFIRDFDLTVPVVNYHAFERIREDLESILYLLTDDNWSIRFVAAPGQPEGVENWPSTVGETLLFSGGLDSLSAAYDLLSQGRNILLVSHITGNPLIRLAQENLVAYLKESLHLESGIEHQQFRVTARNTEPFPFPSDNDREDTQRSRSFLFLVLAALASRRTGRKSILTMAENGQLAINLPLNAARQGAFSTRTAHPEYLANMEKLLSQLLSYPIKIENPYLYRTKAEVVRNVVKSLSGSIALSISCWRGSRVPGSKHHCGVCVPCLLRRIALEANGVFLNEYDRDLLTEDLGSLSEEDLGKRNLVDIIEFAQRFKKATSALYVVEHFPEIVNPHVDQSAAIGMYRRFADEALGVFAKYKTVRRWLE